MTDNAGLPAEKEAREVIQYRAKKAAGDVHKAGMAERAAKAAKDPAAIEASITKKMQAQADFARCMQAVTLKGRPKKIQQKVETLPRPKQWCESFGFSYSVVLNRWNPLMDDATLQKRTSDAVEKALTICEKGGQTPQDVGGGSAASYEWYTPVEILEAARSVLGEIDLDPASCAEANVFVQAERYYTVEDDGLEKANTWDGRVWLNPPYCQPEMDRFADKMIAEYQVGRMAAGILLCNNATDAGFFHRLISASDLFFFFRRRLAFHGPNARDSTARQGQALFYFGEEGSRFKEQFSNFGIVVCRA